MTGAPPKYPKRKEARSEDQVLSEATRRLLKRIKSKAKKEGKPLTHADLLSRGYPKEFILQLGAA